MLNVKTATIMCVPHLLSKECTDHGKIVHRCTIKPFSKKYRKISLIGCDIYNITLKSNHILSCFTLFRFTERPFNKLKLFLEILMKSIVGSK